MFEKYFHHPSTTFTFSAKPIQAMDLHNTVLTWMLLFIISCHMTILTPFFLFLAMSFISCVNLSYKYFKIINSKSL